MGKENIDENNLSPNIKIGYDEDPEPVNFVCGVENMLHDIKEEVMKPIMPIITPTVLKKSIWPSDEKIQEWQEHKPQGQEQQKQEDSSSRLNAVDKVDDLEIFYYDEIVRGACLGNGSFANVYNVKSFKALPQNDEKFTGKGDCDDAHRARLLEARKHYTKLAVDALQRKDAKKKKKEAKTYAIKCLKEKYDDPKVFHFAAKDFETEANLLATLDHPNIISIYAVSASGTKAIEFKSKKPSEDSFKDFFLVLDRLSSTLTKKIDRWKLEKRRIAVSPVFYRAHHFSQMQKRQLFLARTRVAYEIADAIAYLHKNNIVYRDLKTENIGFDAYGKCKLFDFGLARKIPMDLPEKTYHDPTTSTTSYHMSTRTGSLLYMAPEVFKKEPYNEKADVYSFTVLLWNILQLELPYFELIHDMSVFTKEVMVKGTRLVVSDKWPKQIQQLLHEGWAKDFNRRPSMENVCKILKEESYHNTTHDSKGWQSPPTDRMSKRSTFL